MLITHWKLFVILINNSSISSLRWLDGPLSHETHGDGQHRQHFFFLSCEWTNDSIKRSLINFYLNRRAAIVERRRETSNKLTTARCFMCCDWYNKKSEISTESFTVDISLPLVQATSDLRCQVRDLTTANSRVHALKLEKSDGTGPDARRRNIFEWISGSFTSAAINHFGLYDFFRSPLA